MVINYLKLVKFSHTLFALPFALSSFFMAVKTTSEPLSITLLIKVVLAVLFARNAAMSFNRYIDRNYDKANPRTKKREIPSGIIGTMPVIIFVVINSLLFVITSYFINIFCFMLSPIALLVLLGYSYTKRFTALCHLILGVALGSAPLGAWLAITESFDLLPVLLSFAVMFWVAGFDIIYSLQDEYFDRSFKLRSLPVFLGPGKALKVSALLHFLCFVLLVFVSHVFEFSIAGWTGTVIFGLLLLYQHRIVLSGKYTKINLSFFTTNGVASIVWGGLAIVDVLLYQ